MSVRNTLKSALRSNYRQYFNKWPENLKGKVEGPGKAFNQIPSFGPVRFVADFIASRRV